MTSSYLILNHTDHQCRHLCHQTFRCILPALRLYLECRLPTMMFRNTEHRNLVFTDLDTPQRSSDSSLRAPGQRRHVRAMTCCGTKQTSVGGYPECREYGRQYNYQHVASLAVSRCHISQPRCGRAPVLTSSSSSSQSSRALRRLSVFGLPFGSLLFRRPTEPICYRAG